MAIEDIFRALEEQADAEVSEILRVAQVQADAMVQEATDEAARITEARVAAAGAALGFAALLKDPVECVLLPRRRNVPPARVQRCADGGELLVAGGRKAGDHEDGRVRIQRPLLAARVQAAAAVEDAAGIRGQRHGGDGIEQGLHGGGFGAASLW